jgi:DNA repair protein RadC
MGQTLSFRMKDLPVDERPREKLIRSGAEALSNAELISIILRTGSTRQTAVRLADELLARVEGLRGLIDVSVEELTKIPGIGPVKAMQLVALSELTRRLHAAQYVRQKIDSADQLVELLMPQMRFATKEIFMLVLLNSQNQILALQEVSKGTVNETIVHPREVFREAIRRSSTAIVLVHNHPSGDPEPSEEDLEVTRRLNEGGHLLGIAVLDHLIIGDGQYVSLRERGII